MNPFARTYGFFGDFEWRDKIFKELITALPSDCTSRIINASTEKHIELKDGTLFRFVPPTVKCRGMRLYDAYVQPNIDMKYVDIFVSPMIRDSDAYKDMVVAMKLMRETRDHLTYMFGARANKEE